MELELFEVKSIGKIDRNGEGCLVIIDEPFRPAINKIDLFSHIIVVWWAHEFDDDDFRKIYQSELPYAQGVTAGIFATRSPVRPNPIMTTVCKIIQLDEESGKIKINDIDAYSGSPVLDLKVYVPICERVKNPEVAEWAKDWSKWYPEKGLEVEDYE
jgi:tRNA (adenine37-N6)-methyltransferase